MAINDITAELVRSLLIYDPLTGIFTRRVDRKRFKAGTPAGRAHNRGYFQLDVLGHRFLAHRLAWMYVHGQWPTHQIDHINGIRSDNRLANLREATPAENSANKVRLSPRNTSGVRGVYRQRNGLWRAQIAKNRRVFYIGTYKAKADAAKARDEAAKRLYGEFYQPAEH